MRLTNDQIKEFQEIAEKEYGRKLTREEATEAAYDLAHLAELMYEFAKRDRVLQEKLKENPKGFHMEGGPYNCRICYVGISGSQTWYDANGIKCLLCQKALDEGVIPSEVCQDSDSWYAMWELDSQLGIKWQTSRKLMREGKLKARVITTENNNPYFYVFLIKENPDILKPKRKPEVKIVDEKTIEVDLKPQP
jgi:hypothetical protein